MNIYAKLFILLVLCPLTSIAGTCDTIACTGKIIYLYPHGGNGSIYVEIDGNKEALNCNLTQGKYIVLKETSKLHSEIYSMLLAVTIAQKNIRIRIVENSPDCELAYTMLAG